MGIGALLLAVAVYYALRFARRLVAEVRELQLADLPVAGRIGPDAYQGAMSELARATRPAAQTLDDLGRQRR